MSKVDPAQLKHAIESQHGGTATLVQAVPVVERFREQAAWEGVVHVLDVKWATDRAGRAYAWSSPIQGSPRRRFFAVLHGGKVDSPVAAVRAAIVAEHKPRGAEMANGRDEEKKWAMRLKKRSLTKAESDALTLAAAKLPPEGIDRRKRKRRFRKAINAA